MSNPLMDDLFPRFFDFDRNPPETIYHYTTPFGFLEILRTKNLWFSQTGFLNDMVEADYAYCMIRDAIEGRLKSPGSEFERSMLGETLLWSKRLGADSADFASYVACFCEDGDALGQWRGYGSSGSGYAIGMEARWLEACTKGNGVSSHLKKVVYDADVQQAYVLQQIDWFCQQVKRAVEMGKESEQEHLRVLHFQFRLSLAEAYFRFKHPSFRDEREWRLVVFGKQNNGRLKFRSSGSFIVPYLEVGMGRIDGGQDKGLPIAKIVCGPSPHRDLAARAVSLRVAEYDSAGVVKVETSRVPFRPS
ncbi:DUF2971 domain-containing protein [Corallococcus sp. EGB]|uniref:DUF2971 domain-containing protein n=1 Tax=Corallococcus sp. EGB TaxID=1521117 RepID=UPI001CBE7D9B|nr:DUF2971 domain-containing protein [Corallococcus sp. EGB]